MLHNTVIAPFWGVHGEEHGGEHTRSFCVMLLRCHVCMFLFKRVGCILHLHGSLTPGCSIVVCASLAFLISAAINSSM
jgi:hypothetical protein